jgi:Fe-S-cluster containining protein
MKKPKVDRCTGHCCRDFSLPLSPDELQTAYLRWYASQGGKTQITKEGRKPGPLYTDIHLIAPMVEYLGYTEKMPKVVNPPDDVLRGKPERGHRYRCKHLDQKTRNCTIYDIRPTMCQDYPGKHSCNYAGCTWKSRKQKRETRKEREVRRSNLLEVHKDEPTKA